MSTEAPPLEGPPVNEAPPAIAAPPPLSESAAAPIEFTADHRDFFRIWIVNTFLTLVTCGIYAAWAKVRKKRYLYGHTRLLGHTFDYTADPKRLLLGNLIVFVLFLGYAFFGSAYFKVKLISLGFAALAVPWLILRALAFNARNTVYRGLRFRHRAGYGLAFVTYVPMLVVSIASLGIMYPYFSYMRKQLALDYLRYGDSSFRFEAKASSFFGIYFQSALWLLPWIASIFTAGFVVAVTAKHHQPSPLVTNFWFLYGNAALFFICLSLAKLQARTLVFNCAWNDTRLDGHRFRASLSFSRMLTLQVINWLAIISTLGLAYPWATIRKQKYIFSCLEFLPSGSLDRVETLGSSTGAALGDAATDFLGVDIGL